MDIGASTEEDTSNQCDCCDNRPPDCRANFIKPVSPLEIVQNTGLENVFEAKLPALSNIFDRFHHRLWMFLDLDDEDGHDVVSLFSAKVTQESLSGGEPDFSDSSLYLNLDDPDSVPSHYLVLGTAGRKVKKELFERPSMKEAMAIRCAYSEVFYEENKNTPWNKPIFPWEEVSKVSFCVLYIILSYLGLPLSSLFQPHVSDNKVSLYRYC